MSTRTNKLEQFPTVKTKLMYSIKYLHYYLELPYFLLCDYQLDSRTNPFQGEEDDEDITAINTTLTINGPITRSCAEHIYDQVNANLSLPINLENMVVLSTPLLLVVLRNEVEEN